MRLKKRVEELEKKAEWLKCFADEIYDGNEYLLYHLNNLLGRNPASADPLPYVLSTEALVELLKQQKRINETPQQNYQDIIKSLEERVEKQEEAIKALVELCKPLIQTRINVALGEITTAIENELKDLFGSGNTRKCKKSAKSSAEKCKKCGESAKTTKKTSKKENK